MNHVLQLFIPLHRLQKGAWGHWLRFKPLHYKPQKLGDLNPSLQFQLGMNKQRTREKSENWACVQMTHCYSLHSRLRKKKEWKLPGGSCQRLTDSWVTQRKFMLQKDKDSCRECLNSFHIVNASEITVTSQQKIEISLHTLIDEHILRVKEGKDNCGGWVWCFYVRICT